MQRDDKRVPLGTAVMWINASRRGERGHVVGAATRYATVLREDGARLRIRWGALLADDRAPLRTIVTDLDRAQVRFEVGDDVVFTTRDGSTMPGTIEKLNPKRARVRCAQAAMGRALRGASPPGRARSASEPGNVSTKSRRRRARSWTRTGSRRGRCASAPRGDGSARASCGRKSSRLRDGTRRTTSHGT